MLMCSQDYWRVKTHQYQRAWSAPFTKLRQYRSIESPSAEGDLAQESSRELIYSQRERPEVIVTADIVNIIELLDCTVLKRNTNKKEMKDAQMNALQDKPKNDF